MGRRWFVIFATGATLVASANAAHAAPPPTLAEPGAPSGVHYVVSLASDRAGLVWTGTARMRFANAGPAPLSGIWVRLWANGVTGCSNPALRVTGVRGASASEPELGCTALRLRLARPLGAGERTTVALRMSLRVPRVRYRFGIVRGVRLFSNALPILAFKGPDGWHLDRFSRVG